MKQAQPLQRYLATLLLLAVTTLTWAYDFELGGIYYNTNSDGNSVTVTFKTSSDRGYSGKVVIPSTVTYSGKTYDVTGIGNLAFSDCTSLTSITIPESVTRIGYWAFDGCSDLTKAEFASIESLCKINFGNSDANPLYYAKHLYINGQEDEVKDLVIPSSITRIGGCAFSGCTGLTSVTIPNSVTNIGDYAFSGCSGLTSVTIGNSVTSIGNSAFEDCRSLTSITIPESVTSIDSYAFEDCTGLTKAEFASIECLCKINFSSYDSNPLYHAKHLYINGQEDEVKDLVIPSNITRINTYTFYNCSSLTTVTIPMSVTEISGYAFEYCSGLTSVTIPENVTSIGEDAFNGCSGLTSVTIGNNVTSIGEDAFRNCTSLTKAEFASIESLCKINFGNSDANPLYYAKHLYINGQEDEVKDLVIPSSVTGIGGSAFSGCTSLTSVTIPNSVTTIGNYTFYGCTGLSSITIPNNVTNIGASAFYGCTSLTSITIPESVTSIGESAFCDCPSLTLVICHAQNVPSTGLYTFRDVPQSTATLYVPAESIDAYKSTYPWSEFVTILPITPTAVESLTTDETSCKDRTDAAIYDLQGLRLNEKPTRGYYIQGSKKHFVK